MSGRKQCVNSFNVVFNQFNGKQTHPAVIDTSDKHLATSGVTRLVSLTPAPLTKVETNVCIFYLIHRWSVPFAHCSV